MQKRQFVIASSACLTKDLNLQDAEHCEIESEDKLAPTVQDNSVADDKLVNTAKVWNNISNILKLLELYIASLNNKEKFGRCASCSHTILARKLEKKTKTLESQDWG